MRRLSLIALAIVSLFALGGVAQAAPPEPDQTLPPEFAPPGPSPVTDTASAGAFAERFVARNARRIARESGRRIRVLDVNAACVQHPLRTDRFACAFALRALVFRRFHRGHHDDYTPASRRGGDYPRHRRDRARLIGCIGALRVDGGAAPVGRLRFVECERSRRSRSDDTYADPEVEPVS